jgi:hypothetical protein
MQLAILVEPISENTFRASTGAPLDLTTEASSRDEAVDKLRRLIQRRVAAGAELREVQIATKQEHPLARFAGIFKDDPLLDEWKEAMAEYRRQVGGDSVE